MTGPRPRPVHPHPSADDWRHRAACADLPTDWWYPPHGCDVMPDIRRAKAVCAGCGVRVECLEEALRHDDAHGIWGGLTGEERRQMRRRPQASSTGPLSTGHLADPTSHT